MFWTFDRKHVVDLGAPKTVSVVQFDGVSRTSATLLQPHSDALLSLPHGTPFADIAQNAHETAMRLHALGIFQTVDVQLDTDGDERVALVFTVVEKPVSHGFNKTVFRSVDNSMAMASGIRYLNAMGTAETIEASYKYGVDTDVPLYEKGAFSSQLSSGFQALFSKPVNGNADQVVSLLASRENVSLGLQSSYAQQVTGLKAMYKFIDNLVGAKHEVAYNASWRRLIGAGKSMSQTVANDLGESFKSAISFATTVDTRDDIGLPTSGHYLKTLIEGAGLGGDIRHGKASVDAQMNFPLGHGFSVASTLKSGVLWSLGAGKSRVNDRFASSIRGFTQNGVGPKDGNDFVGGDLLASVGISLYTPLPLLENKPIKGHFFANAGNMVKYDSIKPDFNASTRQLFSSVSSAVGVGIAAHFSYLRFELNYCLPVSLSATDRVRPGLQFGLGLNFDHSMFKILPSSHHASLKAQASGADAHSQYKVHDTMRNGIHTVRSDVIAGHPLEAHLQNWDLTQEQLKLDMARSVYGLHQPLRLQMEKHLVNQPKRLSVLKQSNIAQDILSGKDSTIDFEDFLGDQDPSLFLLDVHGCAERQFGLSRTGAPL
ncbi:hypothetical protein HDU78_002147 [Chytriomyces hyalinus]|nr:hypothetical protein HDU78_002147 [Chytriomyces hyalinus]